jgi:TatD DNase family protein
VLIDTHCHLDFPVFDSDRDQVLRQARAQGVAELVIPGVTAATWPRVLELCMRHAGLHPALGLHPGFLAEHCADDLTQLDDRLERQRPIALGEIGLDHAPGMPDHHAQRWSFDQQLQRAATHDLPVLLHVRKAHDEVIQALRATPAPGGIVHAFSGSLPQARSYLALGFKLGFGGMLTYARSTRLRQLARELPLSALVLETDAPDMTVASHQYQRNSPAYLPEVLKALAEIRALPPVELAARTTANAREALKLPVTT